MSIATFEVPSTFGYVVLSCVVGPMVATFAMSGEVMSARKKYNVGYPNLYATPGFHKQADEFNRVQRGHQNMLELVGIFIPAALVGGIKHPIAASVFGLLFTVGNVLYQRGYSDLSLDVKKARHLKGGPLRIIGFFGAVGTTISFSLSCLGWL
mmetsp:Transcript_30907/g.45795  ORF Transcript_30907/g.45795 Transcript_30907/m.45795 type:complete len:153 (-) Transcript_30907:149-607(-)|eukprot:CAMPEP_0194046204 /NCGR_PEP_ID=MMETSP0009_2-20130614/20043_1 /TAXON_ID=210454 /ORGANISM="Grammatophora oceanica, Strain CCMP 410" /LENGTH=152 /DNA_ID=CAMNT_0038691405 /DNA_START=101 /DNA_END=559 /DNA_ORIENTATION=+